MNINILLGETLTACEQLGKDEILFRTASGKTYKLWHYQGCCESVNIEDVNGNLQDLVGAPITLAEEAVNPPEAPKNENHWGSETWTFYRLATVKGYVVIRWYGESNGYYSETVDFDECAANGERIW